MHTRRIHSRTEWGATLLRVSLGAMFLAHSVVLKLLTYGLPGTAAFLKDVGLPGWLAYGFCCKLWMATHGVSADSVFRRRH